MTDFRAAFRLNLEQQKKQAKDLLKAVHAGDAGAIARIQSKGPPNRTIRLADTQRVVARDLGFASWSELKHHIAEMDRARRATQDDRRPPDVDHRTLHLRCGSDIRETLLAAGFQGAFLEHSYPYAHGPISNQPDHVDLEARFIVEFATPLMNLTLDAVRARRVAEERALVASIHDHERIVLWMEHDCFDQLVLVRCLAHYATVARPPVLEIVQTDRFPGSIRFIGLGQLPEEALRLLWERRQPVTRGTLDLAARAFEALCRDDPRPLVALLHSDSSELPYLAPALRRLLQELPATSNGLSFTERMILETLAAAREPQSISAVFGHLTYERDPLPFATDSFLHATVERLRAVDTPLIDREARANPWQDVLTITDVGRAALDGRLDFLACRPRARWVGGVHIQPGVPTWRWIEEREDVRYR